MLCRIPLDVECRDTLQMLSGRIDKRAAAAAMIFLQIAVLAAGCDSLVSLWGAANPSPLHDPTQQFLLVRGLAAPVTVLLLVLQVCLARIIFFYIS